MATQDVVQAATGEQALPHATTAGGSSLGIQISVDRDQ